MLRKQFIKKTPTTLGRGESMQVSNGDLRFDGQHVYIEADAGIYGLGKDCPMKLTRMEDDTLQLDLSFVDAYNDKWKIEQISNSYLEKIETNKEGIRQGYRAVNITNNSIHPYKFYRIDSIKY